MTVRWGLLSHARQCSQVAGLMNILEYKNVGNLFLLRDLPVVVVNVR